jgi:pimeloyl-ACP methyl ester carboxylesterase
LAGYRLIRYHKRGWAGSTHTPAPVSIRDHAADAAALLAHLGVRRAHVAGHSSGATVAAQLALDNPQLVQTLSLLEPPLLSLPAGRAFLDGAAPVLEAYASGDHTGAVAMFISAVSGIDWPSCRALLDEHIPGAVEAAIGDADTFFGVELPAVAEWSFGPREAAAIEAPVLSIVGAETHPLWVEAAAFLRAQVSRIEEVTVGGVGHLLQIQRPEPVASAIAEFAGRHPISAHDGNDVVVQAVGGSSPLAHP